MTLSTQPYKGARDFYPEDKRLQDYLFGVMQAVVQRFGYEKYDAPILEPLELYLAKTGEEIVNEQTYSFEDRGGRKIAIRPEMTPTVSRMVAAHRQELAYPLRWYSIPNLWRYERPQRGRLREHWQLNVDLFGVASLEAEHEMIQMMSALMSAYGAKPEMYVIKLNSRILVDELLLNYFKVSQVQAQSLRKLIDRMHKLEHPAFAAEIDAIFTPSQREDGLSDQLLIILKTEKISELPELLQQHPTIAQLQKLTALAEASNITNVVFDITLMRGFDYYTDIVFEVFDTNPTNSRALFGGGRYDGLVGLFGVEPIPTIGFGVGDVTLADFLETHGLLPTIKTETDVYVLLIGDVYETAQKVIGELREMGLNVAVDLSGRKLDAQIKTAYKKAVPYALFIGEQELAAEQYMLKDLRTGIGEKHGIQRIVSIVKDYRNQVHDRD